MSAASPSPGVSFSLNWQYWVSTHLVLLIREGIDLKEGTQAKIFCAIQTREVSLSMKGMRNSLKSKMFYLWGKGVLKAQLLQSWPKFEDGMDVEDRDGQVERL